MQLEYRSKVLRVSAQNQKLQEYLMCKSNYICALQIGEFACEPEDESKVDYFLIIALDYWNKVSGNKVAKEVLLQDKASKLGRIIHCKYKFLVLLKKLIIMRFRALEHSQIKDLHLFANMKDYAQRCMEDKFAYC